MTTHLQYIGQHNAVYAKDVKPGQIRVYNFGITAEVTKVEPLKSGKSVEIYTVHSDGREYSKTCRNDSLIAVKSA